MAAALAAITLAASNPTTGADSTVAVNFTFLAAGAPASSAVAMHQIVVGE